MSYYEASVPAQEDTVVRPVIRKVLEQIASTWFADSPRQLYYLDHTNQRHPMGTYLGENANHVHLEGDSRLEATATLKIDNTTLFTQENTNDNVVPCWADPDIRAYISLRRLTKTVDLRIRYTSQSRGEVSQWLSQYQHRVIAGNLQMTESSEYEVVVPPHFPIIIQELHRAREANAGYGDTFEDYMNAHFLTVAAERHHPDGKSKTLVLREKIQNIAIAIPAEIPEVTRNNVGGWEVELLLEFQLDVPSILTFDYSEFVHGQELRPPFVNKELNRNAVSRTSFVHGSPHGRVMGQMVDHMNQDVYRNEPYIFPSFDTMVINTDPIGTTPLLQVRIMIDPDQPRLIQDLTTLEEDIGIQFHQELIPFILNHKEIAFNRFVGIFTLFMYGQGKLLTPDHYHVTPEGLIMADYDLSERQEYHLVIGVKNDLPSITEGLLRPLLLKGNLFLAILRYCYPELKAEDLPLLDRHGGVPRHELLKVGKRLPTRMKPLSSRMFLASAIMAEANTN